MCRESAGGLQGECRGLQGTAWRVQGECRGSARSLHGPWRASAPAAALWRAKKYRDRQRTTPDCRGRVFTAAPRRPTAVRRSPGRERIEAQQMTDSTRFSGTFSQQKTAAPPPCLGGAGAVDDSTTCTNSALRCSWPVPGLPDPCHVRRQAGTRRAFRDDWPGALCPQPVRPPDPAPGDGTRPGNGRAVRRPGRHPAPGASQVPEAPTGRYPPEREPAEARRDPLSLTPSSRRS